MKKKLLTAVLTIVMTIGACLTCFAADPAISADEQKILDALTAGVEMNGVKVAIPTTSSYYQDAVSYLTSNVLDAKAVEGALTQIDEAKTTIANSGATSVADLKEKLKTNTTLADKLTSEVKVAGTAVGAKITVNLSSGTPSVVIEDANGNEHDGNDAIAQTGFNYTATVVVVLAVVAALGGCVVVARKNKLFAQEA